MPNTPAVSLTCRLLQLLCCIVVYCSCSSSSSSSPLMNLGCPCVHFNTSGVFQTPDYPKLLPMTPCLLFHFVAPVGNRVLLTIDTIELPVSPKCDSFLHIYDQLHTRNLSKATKEKIEICDRGMLSRQGTASPYDLIAHSFSSQHRHLVLHLRTTEASRGFRGRYEFFSQDEYKTSGIEQSPCSYRMQSRNGSIYSPRYPSTLPANTRCSYHFPAKKRLRLTITSRVLHLATACTVLYTEDIQGGESEWPTQQRTLYFTTNQPVTVDVRCGADVQRPSAYRLDFSYEREDEEADSTASRGRAPANTDLSAPCSETIDSSRSKTGHFRSSQLRASSSSSSSSLPHKCTITLQGAGNGREKISIKFTYFNLYTPNWKGSNTSCSNGESLVAYVLLDMKYSSLLTDGWCRDDMPPPLISPSGVIRLQYTTRQKHSAANASSYGFAFDYSFHEEWRMGGMLARNVPLEEMDRRLDSPGAYRCQFNFNSSMAKQGEFWSVNYPGLYPRKTSCQYIFYGSRTDEVVHIQFDYFDVEGVHPCVGVSKSDYILFSNYQTLDRTNKKYCGKSYPRDSTSESNYYRLIFETDEVFDGTGFYARYQFLTPPKETLLKVKSLSSTATAHLLNVFLHLFLLYRL